MSECNFCGKCCFYQTGDKNPDGSLILKACKYLVKMSENKYLCRIYRNRLGKHIGTDNLGRKIYCTMYNSLSSEIKGCPINIGNKPLREVVISSDKRSAVETLITIG